MDCLYAIVLIATSMASVLYPSENRLVIEKYTEYTQDAQYPFFINPPDLQFDGYLEKEQNDFFLQLTDTQNNSHLCLSLSQEEANNILLHSIEINTNYAQILIGSLNQQSMMITMIPDYENEITSSFDPIEKKNSLELRLENDSMPSSDWSHYTAYTEDIVFCFDPDNILHKNLREAESEKKCVSLKIVFYSGNLYHHINYYVSSITNRYEKTKTIIHPLFLENKKRMLLLLQLVQSIANEKNQDGNNLALNNQFFVDADNQLIADNQHSVAYNAVLIISRWARWLSGFGY